MERDKWETPHIMEHMSLGANSRYKKSRLFEAEFKKTALIVMLTHLLIMFGTMQSALTLNGKGS